MRAISPALKILDKLWPAFGDANYAAIHGWFDYVVRQTRLLGSRQHRPVVEQSLSSSILQRLIIKKSIYKEKILYSYSY